MRCTRRQMVGGCVVGLAGMTVVRKLPATDAPAAAAVPKVRIAARQFGDNFAAAKQAGMDGIELGVGGAAEKLRISDAAYRATIKERVKETGVVVSSLSMDLLNGNPVATDPQAPAWLEQCITAAQDLGASGILVPFFGQASLLEKKELKKDLVDALVARMKEFAPKAKAAGVVLGLENTCSAKQNLEILDRIGSEGVGCYYDIGNSTNNGYDVPEEIRALKGRLCPCMHFKDGGSFLGEGKVRMEPVGSALKDIGLLPWIVLETACPTKNTEADCTRNADFTRKLLGQ